MEGLQVFSKKYGLNKVYSVHKTLFYPCMTTFAFDIDLARVPDGKIKPSPWYIGPVEVTEDFSHLTCVSDTAIVRIEGNAEDTRMVRNDFIQVEDGKSVFIAEGIVKSTLQTDNHEYGLWFNSLIDVKKPGGFGDLKDSADTMGVDIVEAQELFPLDRREILYMNAEKKKKYDDCVDLLNATVASSDALRIRVKIEEKTEKARSALELYRSSGFLAGKLSAFHTAIKSLEEAIKRNQEAEADALKKCAQVTILIKKYIDFFKRPDAPEKIGDIGHRVGKIEPLLQEFAVDRETGEIGNKFHSHKTLCFLEETIDRLFKVRIEKLIKPTWKLDRVDPEKALQLVKTTRASGIVQPNSRLDELLRETETKALNKEANCEVGEIHHIVSQLTPPPQPKPAKPASNGEKEEPNSQKPAKPASKEKSSVADSCGNKMCKKTKILANGLCKTCLSDDVDLRYEEYCRKNDNYKAHANPSDDQVLHFKSNVAGKVKRAHKKFVKEPSQETYDLLAAAFVEAESFFASLTWEMSESDESDDSDEEDFGDGEDEEDEEEEEEEESEEEEEEEEEVKIPRKRARETLPPDPFHKRALLYCEKAEADELNALVANGEIARMREKAAKIIDKHVPQYRVLFTDTRTNEHETRFDGLNPGGPIFYTEAEAHEWAKDLLSAPNHPYIYEVIRVTVK